MIEVCELPILYEYIVKISKLEWAATVFMTEIIMSLFMLNSLVPNVSSYYINIINSIE